MKTPAKYFVVSGTYNAESYVDKCVKSVNEQNVFDNYQIYHIVIDDGSTDKTAEVIKQHATTDTVVIRHEKNKGPISSQLAGFEWARKNGDPHDVIIQLDGDDWFNTKQAVSIVHDTYKETVCGATYGDYVCTDGAPSCCRIPDWGNLRKDLKKNGWPFSHLRTFRVGYTAHLKDEDLRDEDGHYFPAAPDVAVCLPIFEYAGRDLVTFIQSKLVVYNRQNPIREARIRYFDQVRCALACYQKAPKAVVDL